MSKIAELPAHPKEIEAERRRIEHKREEILQAIRCAHESADPELLEAAISDTAQSIVTEYAGLMAKEVVPDVRIMSDLWRRREALVDSRHKNGTRRWKTEWRSLECECKRAGTSVYGDELENEVYCGHLGLRRAPRYPWDDSLVITRRYSPLRFDTERAKAAWAGNAELALEWSLFVRAALSDRGDDNLIAPGLRRFETPDHRHCRPRDEIAARWRLSYPDINDSPSAESSVEQVPGPHGRALRDFMTLIPLPEYVPLAKWYRKGKLDDAAMNAMRRLASDRWLIQLGALALHDLGADDIDDGQVVSASDSEFEQRMACLTEAREKKVRVALAALEAIKGKTVSAAQLEEAGVSRTTFASYLERQGLSKATVSAPDEKRIFVKDVAIKFVELVWVPNR